MAENLASHSSVDHATMWRQAAIRDVLNRCGGVVAHAGRELGIARTTLLSRMDALGIRATKRF